MFVQIMTDPVVSVGQQLIAFLPNMRRFALSLSRNSQVADDLVQLACERALAGAASFQAGTRFDAWIFRIIRNLWIDQLRRDRIAGPSEKLSDIENRVAGSDERSVEARLFLNEVWTAISALPEEQREVMMLVCVEELSYKDAAATLHIPVGTVMSRLARARLNIAKAVGISADPPRSGVSVKDQR